MLKSKIIVLTAAMAIVTALGFSQPAKAVQDAGPGSGGGSVKAPKPDNKCGDVETSFDFNCPSGTSSKSSDVQRNPIYAFLVAIINFLAAGVGIVVVGGIVWGSITYIHANGNSGKTQQGISMIVNSIIGLLMFIFMYAVLNYLVPGGLIG